MASADLDVAVFDGTTLRLSALQGTRTPILNLFTRVAATAPGTTTPRMSFYGANHSGASTVTVTPL